MKAWGVTALVLGLCCIAESLIAQGQKQREVLSDQQGYIVPLRQNEFQSWRTGLSDSVRTLWVEELIALVRSGELMAYGLDDDGRPCTLESCRMDKESIDAILNPLSIAYDRSSSDGKPVTTVNTIQASDIVALDFIEEWVYDHKRKHFSKQVNAIGLMVADDDVEGMTIYYPLFYIWMEESVFRP